MPLLVGKFQNASCISCILKHSKISPAKFTMVNSLFLLQNSLTSVFARSRVSSFVQFVYKSVWSVEILKSKELLIIFFWQKDTVERKY